MSGGASPGSPLWPGRRGGPVALRAGCHASGSAAAAPNASRARERRRPTLPAVLVHLILVTGRHTWHADIIREAIDGAAGLLPGVSNLPDEAGATAWKEHDDKPEEHCAVVARMRQMRRSARSACVRSVTASVCRWLTRKHLLADSGCG